MIPTLASVRLSARATMLAMCALLLVSCSDKNATGPIVPEQPPIAGAALLTCTVTTEGVARMECRPSVGQVFAMPGKSLVPTGVNASLLSAVGGTIILGGQGTNVQLTSSNIVATATQVTGDVTVQNLIGQPLGTADGTTLAPEGVRVFFSSGPNANTGTVTVGNANGTAFFTASDQPYHQYNEILSTNEVSPSKQWVFNLAGGATTFTFGVYVWAPVQYPDGWIDVTPSSDALDLNTGDVTQQLTGTVKNQLGATVVETITWGTSDSEVATVDAAGLVTAHEAGSATITATAGTKTGSSSITVTGPSLTNSTVTSQFNEIARDGAATSVITVQLKDGANANVTIGGRTVVIATDKGTISATTDNGNGTYTATLTSSTTIETATVTATVDDDALTDNATVNFISTALAAADTYSETVHGNVSVNSANVAPTAFNVLTNDATEFDTQVTGAGWLATPNKTENGGDVAITAAGTFTYNPPAGFEGTDRFTYTITGGTTANVTLSVSGMLWFVDASAASCASVANGCGRLSNPFNSLADFNTANNGTGNNPAAGDGVFIFENASSYTGPLNLLATQKAIGQDATASLATLGYATPTSSTALPAMNSGNGVFVTIAGADGVNLALNNTLRGFTIANTAGQGIGGTSFGTLTLGGDVAINATAQAIALTTGTINGNLVGVTSTGGPSNVVLASVAGTSNFGTGALSGTTGTALWVVGDIDLTYGGSITSSSAGVGIRVGGTADVTLTGNFSFSGSNTAILVQTHTGTLNMSGQYNTPAGDGAYFHDADGTYTFNVAPGSGVTGGSHGVTITTDTDGTFTFGANFDISGTTGAAFETTGPFAADLSPTVTFNGDLTQSGAAQLASLGRLTTGANLTFAGSLSMTSGTVGAIGVSASDGGTITFSGASKVIQTTGAISAVQIVTAGPTVNFTNGGLALTTSNGAIAVTAAGALNISGNNNTIVNAAGTAVDLANTSFSVASGTGNTISSGGRALNLSTVTIGAGGVNYNSVSSSAPATLSAIRLNAVNATNPIAIAGGTLAGATTAHTVDILGSSGSFTYAGTLNGAGTGAAIHVNAGSIGATFSGPVSNAGSNAVVFVEAAHTGSVTLNNTVTSTAGTGLQFDNADGTYNISPSAATSFGATDAGVDIINGSEGTFTFGANLAINNPTGTAFRVNSSTPAVTWNGNITKTNGGLAIDITSQASSARSITFQTGTIAANTNTTGIQLSDVDGTVSFNGTTTLSGSDAGIDVINGSAGTIAFAATTSITNPSGAAVFVDASAPTLTVAGSISTNAGRPVHIEDLTGGSITISASINATAQGILVQNNTAGAPAISFTGARTLSTTTNHAITLDNNDNATINFGTAAMTLTTSTGEGFRAVNGGTVNVTGSTNTIAASGGVALNVNATTIGANGLTFRTVSATGGSNGIVLTGTGTNGLTITGDGATAGSGGVIINTTGADGGTTGSGIFLSNAQNISIAFMAFSGHSNWGLRGQNVVNFSMNRTRFTGTNGTSTATDDGSVYFTELTGVAAITGSFIDGGFENGMLVDNTTGTLNRITFTGDTIGYTSETSGDGLRLESGGGVLNATIQTTRFERAAGDVFQHNIIGTAQSDLVFQNNTVINSHPAISGGGGGITITAAESGDLTYDIFNNTLRGSKGTALVVNKPFGGLPGNGTMVGRIRNNIVGTAGGTQNGPSEGHGMSVGLLAQGNHTTRIEDNQIYDYAQMGIDFNIGGTSVSVTTIAHNGTVNATVYGNTIAEPRVPAGGIPQNGIHLNLGTNSTGGNDAYVMCLDLGSATAADRNTINGSSALGGTDFRLRQRFSTTLRMPGYAGANNDNAAVVSYVQNRNNNSGTTTGAATNTVVTGGVGFLNTSPAGSACAQP